MIFKTLATLLTAFLIMNSPAPAKEARQINALMLTGGGFHDYNKQSTILTEGVGARVNVKWTVIHKDAAGIKEVLSGKDWANGFDVVVYNICFADETDAAFVRQLTEAHAGGIPAVVIHCTMHSYHWKTNDDAWVRFLGVTSMRHGEQAPILVKGTQPVHPVMKSLPVEWITPTEELYEMEKVWDTATVLLSGSIDSGKTFHAVAWTNQFGKARVFGCTIGHNDGTMLEKNYLDLVSRGLLWSTGHLDAEGVADPVYVVKK